MSSAGEVDRVCATRWWDEGHERDEQAEGSKDPFSPESLATAGLLKGQAFGSSVSRRSRAYAESVWTISDLYGRAQI